MISGALFVYIVPVLITTLFRVIRLNHAHAVGNVSAKMKLRQLQETVRSPKMTNRKLAALLASAAAVVWTAGFILVTVGVKVGIEMLFIFTWLFMMSFITFTWKNKPKPEHQPPKIKQPQTQDYSSFVVDSRPSFLALKTPT